MTCRTCSEDLEPWQRALLTDRLGLRRDAYMARVKGGYVDREYIHLSDVTAVLAERHSDRMEELQDRSMGTKARRRRDRPYPLAQPVEDLHKARGDESEPYWRWGDASRAFGAAGGGGTQRVGPGWSTDAPRFDAGEVEVLIDGRRCVEIDGAWRDDTTGDLCTAPEA